MAKKIIMFVSSVVLSFGVAFSADDVVAPLTNSQDFLATQSISAAIKEIEAQGISREEILAVVGADKNISAKDWSALQAYVTQNGNVVADTEIGSITIGQAALTFAVLAAVYYGAPVVKKAVISGWKKTAEIAGSFSLKKKTVAFAIPTGDVDTQKKD